MSSSTGSQTVHIVVYEGVPVDLTETRHTAIYIKYSDGTSLLTHVTGGHGFFQHEERENANNPEESVKFLCLIPVATIPSTTASVRQKISGTPINNDERSWNCQHWVSSALEGLVEENFLSKAEMESATFKMVDTILEARDKK